MDNDELNKRRWMLSQNMQIEHSQMPLDAYLDRLTKDERNGILTLIKKYNKIHEEYFRNSLSYPSIIGVGTVTYPEEEWIKLAEYLKKYDPEKLRYALKKGEDIDLVLCPSMKLESNNWGKLQLSKYEREEYDLKYMQTFNSKIPPTDQHMFYLWKRLKTEESYRIKYSKTQYPEINNINNYDIFTRLVGMCKENNIRFSPPKEDMTDFGTSYHIVPEDKKAEYNEGIVRVKGKEYDKTMKIHFDGCRPFHIYVRDNLSFAERIAEEKIENIPFTIISVPGNDEILEDLIRVKNGEPKIDRTPMRPKQWKRGDEIRF